MYIKTFHYVTVWFAVVVCIISLTIPTTHAAFSESELTQQKQGVHESLVTTLTEHLKLLQMIYINQLEQRILLLKDTMN